MTKTTYSPLRNYTEAEFEVLLQTDPSFLATDTKNYSDSTYVHNMCNLYVCLAKHSVRTCTQIKKFSIANLEKALEKLYHQQSSQHKELCQMFGIIPKKQTGKKIHPLPKSDALISLSSWGYIELYSPNFLDTVEKISKKLYSEYMTPLEKAKYAHLFFLFVYGFNMMPYDIMHFLRFKENHSLSENEKKTGFYKALAEAVKTEDHTSFEAVMLQNTYDSYFKNLPDETINADAVALFLEEVLGDQDYLKLKEFVDLLNTSEKEWFTKQRITRLKYNNQIREIKEKIFPTGCWGTELKLFYVPTKNDKNFNRAIRAAWNKFVANDCTFGVNVQPYKTPQIFQTITGKQYSNPGYLYAYTPRRIRVSDENELFMMRTYLKQLEKIKLNM